MVAKVVEEREGCYVRIKRLGIAQVANPGVLDDGLDEGLDVDCSKGSTMP